LIKILYIWKFTNYK